MIKNSLKPLLLSAFCIALPCAAAAQEQSVKLKSLPPAAQKTVEEQSKGATIRGLSKEVEKGKTEYELELTVNGRRKDLLIDSTGAILEVEEGVTLDSLAPEVRAEVEKNIGRAKLLRLESVMRDGVLTGYEASVSKAGRKSGVLMGPDGKLLPKKKKTTK